MDLSSLTPRANLIHAAGKSFTTWLPFSRYRHPLGMRRTLKLYFKDSCFCLLALLSAVL